MDETNGIVITKIIDAPREMVWKAWTDPETAKKWWGPKDFTAPSIKIDLREGGKYIFAMRGPKGSEWDKDMYSAGVYKEIVPHEKLVVTDYFSDEFGNKQDPANFGQDPDFPEESTVTVLFQELGKDNTKLSITYQKPQSEEQFRAMEKSGMIDGWNSSLDKLAGALKS
ncbi:MAG: hypothetical protein UV73_C0010G0014 [Candidatus Gottesmanbacteria bacterium GW2011_GWA2_43_14]|uniref:Activator of Hsp90 ATPase homologue 1/2-like C-terminal domain-containing protein n=1 Tax=Candidatus Gottesmanbacteria bacterium GW2011_GWA2_43_14 TaxID=1618443 RepID=A0A0G1DFL0_9BACT|nr:MAG: hypothetical protein UV73_C0010G0014 [Candidatus Gottesmanbacteria bacterium GW2011_GWA2_43_14]